MPDTAASAALMVCLAVCTAAILTTWLLSVLTRDHSWMDRAWSLLPPLYLWIFAVAGGLATPGWWCWPRSAPCGGCGSP